MQTSWESSHQWYDTIVGEKGHYYHESVVFPHLLPLLDLKPQDSLLDLGCGQGVLERVIPKTVRYVGVDLSSSLVKSAKRLSKRPFYVADITKPLSISEPLFSHAALVLVTQNLENPLGAFQNAAKFLQPGGKLAIVLNHPCFRIPRQSSWHIDEPKKLQCRRIDRYMSDLKIPISTNPGREEKSAITYSFHFPLSFYVKALKEAGFMIETLEEWSSKKVSMGKKSTMENRARQEFPLFLCLIANRIR